MIQFKIVTPSGVAYEDNIISLTLPTKSGEITVLANHIPLVTLLRPGEMIVRKRAEKVGALENGASAAAATASGDNLYEMHFAVSHGIVQVRRGSEVVILSDTAERAEEIDIAKAEEARKRAEEALKRKGELDDVAFSRLQAVFDRELAKTKVGSRRQARKRPVAASQEYEEG